MNQFLAKQMSRLRLISHHKHACKAIRLRRCMSEPKSNSREEIWIQRNKLNLDETLKLSADVKLRINNDLTLN